MKRGALFVLRVRAGKGSQHLASHHDRTPEPETHVAARRMQGRDAHVHLDPQEIPKWIPPLLFHMIRNTQESMLRIPNAH